MLGPSGRLPCPSLRTAKKEKEKEDLLVSSAEGKTVATVLGSKRKEDKGTAAYSTASLPLGFKFSPTDEQLIDPYLRLKNAGRESEVQIIGEVDFYNYEPWDLPELSVIKSDQLDWFFFCRRHAKELVFTDAGYWKNIGNDRSIRPSGSSFDIGMKKTLVFYKGCAPEGTRTDWIMHEYRATEGDLAGASPHQDQGVKSNNECNECIPKMDQQNSSDLKFISAGPYVKTPFSDDFHWQKYGTKIMMESSPEASRTYYGCSFRHSAKCLATKVESFDLSGRVTKIVYRGQHSHPSRQGKNAPTQLLPSGATQSEVEVVNKVLEHDSKDSFALCHLFQKRRFDNIKEDEIYHTGSSLITTKPSYADSQGPYIEPSDLFAHSSGLPFADPFALSARPFDLSAHPSDLFANSSGLPFADPFAHPSDLFAYPSDLSANPSDLFAHPSDLFAHSSGLPFADPFAHPSDLSKEELLQWKEPIPEAIEKRITSESQGEVSEDLFYGLGIKPEISEMDWKTFSMGLEIYSDTIIQREVREVLQSCLMWGGLGLTEPPKDEDWENAKMIYLMDNELSVLPQNPRCPLLLTLFLQRNYKLRTIPPSFFDYMPALQILNLSRTGIKSLPESILRLVSLKRLFLNDCHRFMILSPKVGELKRLEILDLDGTDIMDLPKEIKELTNLTCLEVSLYADLSNGRRAMQSAVVVPCGIISALSHLEELNINVNPDDKRWNACVEAIVTEVCTLESLNTLKFYFPRVENVRHFLLNSPMWLNPSLSHFRFTVGHHVKRIISRLPRDVEFELERWERCLKYINGVAVPREIKRVLQYSTAFFLERHATVKKLSDFGIGNMKQLKCCVVGECNEVEVIIDETDAHEEDDEADAHEEDDGLDAYREDGSSEILSKTSGAKKFVLGSLEYLCVYYMKNLTRIWKGPVQPKCLSLLKFLTFRTCPQLTTVFTKGLLDNLYNLEELTIEDCPAIKTLVCEVSAEHKTSDFLPNLKRISLHCMPKLDTISSGLHIAPSLEWLSFYNCPNLKNLSIEEVSSKDLKKIKGERSWWEALEWESGRPAYLDDIFVPIKIWDC